MKAVGAKGIVVLLLTLLAGSAAWATSFVHGPYSQAPCAESVIISWQSEPPTAARVEFGPRVRFDATGEMPEATFVPLPGDDAEATTHVELGGLEAGTEYVYRVVLDAGGEEVRSEVGRFRTAPGVGAPVSFAVLADTQWQLEGANLQERIGAAIAADPTPFHFILHAGDVVESPSSYYWDHWFASFDAMLRRAPFLPTLGNHEKNHRSYYETFCLPPGAGKNDEQWWALHWGDVVVVGLDTNVKKATDFTAQQDWARLHLSGSEPHKFVIFHHPVFGDGEYFLDRIYHPIFVETQVDVVFNGHSHHYEHIVRDGVTYLVVGGGGAEPRETTPEHIVGSDVSIEGQFFYTRVTASVERIRVETVSVAELLADGTVASTGDTMDAFSLPDEAETRRPIALLTAIAAVLAAVAVWLLVKTAND